MDYRPETTRIATELQTEAESMLEKIPEPVSSAIGNMFSPESRGRSAFCGGLAKGIRFDSLPTESDITTYLDETFDVSISVDSIIASQQSAMFRGWEQKFRGNNRDLAKSAYAAVFTTSCSNVLRGLAN